MALQWEWKNRSQWKEVCEEIVEIQNQPQTHFRQCDLQNKRTKLAFMTIKRQNVSVSCPDEKSYAEKCTRLLRERKLLSKYYVTIYRSWWDPFIAWFPKRFPKKIKAFSHCRASIKLFLCTLWKWLEIILKTCVKKVTTTFLQQSFCNFLTEIGLWNIEFSSLGIFIIFSEVYLAFNWQWKNDSPSNQWLQEIFCLTTLKSSVVWIYRGSFFISHSNFKQKVS